MANVWRGERERGEREGGGSNRDTSTQVATHTLRATKHAVTSYCQKKRRKSTSERDNSIKQREKDRNQCERRGRASASKRRNKIGSEGEKERRARGREYDEDGQRQRESGLGRNESEKDDEIGLCRRRRDSTERAGVPQTGRRLFGMQAPLLSFPPGRAIGPDPSTLLPASCVPPRSFISANPYGPHRGIATLPSTTTIANYGT